MGSPPFWVPYYFAGHAHIFYKAISALGCVFFLLYFFKFPPPPPLDLFVKLVAFLDLLGHQRQPIFGPPVLTQTAIKA